MRKLISLTLVIASSIAFALGNKLTFSIVTLIAVFTIVLVLFFRYRSRHNATQKNLTQRENIEGFPYL